MRSKPLLCGNALQSGSVRFGSVLSVGTALLLTGCESTRGVDPAPPDNRFPDSASRFQAETALEAARRPDGGRRLVLAYMDTSGEGAPEFFDGPPATVRYGASSLGWSTSDDDGLQWTRRGKIRPPAGWAAITSDPAVAVDPTNPRRVFLSAMGTSDQRWTELGAAIGGTGRPSADSVCIARSLDGGATFPDVSCFVAPTDRFPGDTVPPDTSAVDLPAIAVDGRGCLWMAYDDQADPPGRTMRVFRNIGPDGVCNPNDWTRFVEKTSIFDPRSGGGPGGDQPANQVALGEKGAIFHRDAAGDMWLGSAQTITFVVPELDAAPSGRLRRFKYPATGEGSWIDSDFLGFGPACSSFVPWTPEPELLVNKQNVKVGSSPQRAIRYARRFDFDVSFDAEGYPTLIFAVTDFRAPNTNSRFVQTFAIGNAFVHPVQAPEGCVTLPSGGTIATPGEQAMPMLRRRETTGLTPGVANEGDLWLGYLDTAGSLGVAAPRVDMRAALVTYGRPRSDREELPAPTIALLFPTYTLNPPDNPVCSALNGFWGDYFGLAVLPGPDGGASVRVAALSDSRREQPCTATQTNASPLHVRVSRW